MNISDCFYLGHITKPFGYKGEVDIFLDVDEPQHYAKLDAVFVELKGQLIPYFIEHIRLKDNHAVVQFQDMVYEFVPSLIGAKLYLPMAALPKLSGNKFYFHEVIGFLMNDVNHGELGVLENIMDNGPQPIFQIKHSSGKEILIPVIDDFIVEVNRENRSITTNAPEGLIEFYLS
ncbi:MAG: ribosome maturation factor RimM [Bacteroidales bacterium]|jgi:16S rRNA processing protein RimM|nr:ribosome maturation factor RimM [Bacteroidales bacterium]